MEITKTANKIELKDANNNTFIFDYMENSNSTGFFFYPDIYLGIYKGETEDSDYSEYYFDTDPEYFGIFPIDEGMYMYVAFIRLTDGLKDVYLHVYSENNEFCKFIKSEK
jgi:hypothetical protein